MTPALMNYIGGVLETLSVFLNALTFFLGVVLIVLGIGVLIASEDVDDSRYRKLRRLFFTMIILGVTAMTMVVFIPDKKTFTALYETYWKEDVNTHSGN